MLLLGVICLLFEKPWRGFKKNSVTGMIIIFASILFSVYYASRIISPDISSYTGEFIESHRNSRVAPPLPFTNEYVFYDGYGKRKVVYLDTGSKNAIFGEELEIGKTYTVYFDDLTKIIVRIELES